MAQVYLKDAEGPLYAYVEFSVGGSNVIYSTSLAGVSPETGYDLDHVANYESGDTYISNTVISLAVNRKSTSNSGGISWSVGDEFTISVFDESAVYVEDLIANAINGESTGVNCYIEYGWSERGRRIEDRCKGFNGQIKSYSISFEGSSTVLTVIGTSMSSVSSSITYADNTTLPDEITSTGNPSEIVKWIFENNILDDGVTYKWDDTTIDETEPVYLNDAELKNLICNNTSVFSYIKYSLCPIAKTLDGRSGFAFSLVDDPEDPNAKIVYFKSMGVASGSFEVANEEGENVGGAGEVSNFGEVIRDYVYYVGAEKGEVLSWSVDHEYMIGDAYAGTSYAVNSTTNEMIECRTSSGSKRVMGLSSGAYNTLSQCMQDLWIKYASQAVKASLDILGDANINPNDHIYIDVYTKYNLLHHTSGKYLVCEVDDNVDSAGFVTSLTLIKEPDVSEFQTELVQEGTPKVNGIDYNTDPRFQAPKSGIDYDTDPRFKAPLPASNQEVKPIVSSNLQSIESNFGSGGNTSQPIVSSNVKAIENKIGKSSTNTVVANDPKGTSNVASPVVY